ncbi:MAG: DNA gyrase inhibitor YacG [Caulobacteraceae bacterium]
MTAPRCPVCRKPADPAYRPFCSRRCSEVDLQRWLTGRYVLSGDSEDEGESPPPEDEPPS